MDTEGWDDGYGDGCKDFKNLNYCANCEAAEGWDDQNWGLIEYYGALENCCESCGCETSGKIL